jgi:hypothetical protein
VWFQEDDIVVTEDIITSSYDILQKVPCIFVGTKGFNVNGTSTLGFCDYLKGDTLMANVDNIKKSVKRKMGVVDICLAASNKKLKSHYSIDIDSKNEFAALASMAVVIGQNDDSSGGAKEAFVNSFNQEMSRRFVREETASTGTATDSQGKSYNASPMMVLYKEPGRPPGMIAARENEIVNALNFEEN